MKIVNDIEAVGLSLYVKETLIIADVHMGFEEYVNKSGILIPRTQFDDTIKELNTIFKKLQGFKIQRIIINGDLKHEFGTISETEWRNTLKLIDYLLKHCKEIILIKGNHDTILGPIAKKRGIKVKSHVLLDNILVCHGNEVVEEVDKAEIIIIGHEHPAISLNENSRVEKFKCYLKGKWHNKTLIVMPSFNTVTEGSDMLKEQRLSPFLQQSIDNFHVYVVDKNKIFDFNKLKFVKKSLH